MVKGEKFEIEDEYQYREGIPNISDDEEANEDLCLKIVEKSLLMRAAKLVPYNYEEDDVLYVETMENNCSAVVSDICLSSTFIEEADASAGPTMPNGMQSTVIMEVGDSGDEKRLTKKKRKKKKVKKTKVGEHTMVATNEEKRQTDKSANLVGSLRPKTSEIIDNTVFRKLVRGPRYFDPPESSWGTCYNCGEEGHTAVNCTTCKRTKPCFKCGSLKHNTKGCLKAQDCFICKKGGHLAKDCPEKHPTCSSSLKICLKCGNSGHDMFSCKSDYSIDDIKNIQCYMCKNIGHLCCVNSTHYTPREISCYKCGQLGHTGLACARLCRDSTSKGSLSSCYKCGEEGHIARECMGSSKVGESKHKLSTSTPRFQKQEIMYHGCKSAPDDLGDRKRKKPKYEEIDTTTPRTSRHGDGWTMEDPGQSSNGEFRRYTWNTPMTMTPSNNNYAIGFPNSGDYIRFTSPEMMHKVRLENSYQGSIRTFQDGYSASRFSNPTSDGVWRNYGW